MSDTLVLPPEVAKDLIGFLIEQDDVAAICDGRIFTQWPGTKAWPAVRVTQYNDSPTTDDADFLHVHRFQIETVGDPLTRWATRAASHTVRAALTQQFRGGYDHSIVTAVRCYGARDDYDETFTPALPRSLFLADIYATPNPDTGS